MDYRVGDYVFDGWRITTQIGSGTSGTVYEVQKKEQGVILTKAVKVMSVPPDKGIVKTLQYEGWNEEGITNYLQSVMDELKNEIRIMVSLKDSPHIVSCDDFSIKRAADLAQWDVLILMEKLTPLDQWVSENVLTEADVLNIAIQLTQALMITEEKGVIHRDIKPENIFVSTPAKHMNYFKIGDFGIARAYDKATGELSKKGTANYMAPEVFRGDLYDNTVDIYSLGLVLYKLLNKNRLPFFPVDQLYNSLEEQSALVRRMNGDEDIALPVMVSNSFGAIILKMINYRPEERYRTAEELYNALKKVIPSDRVVWSGQSANRIKKENSDIDATSHLWRLKKENKKTDVPDNNEKESIETKEKKYNRTDSQSDIGIKHDNSITIEQKGNTLPGKEKQRKKGETPEPPSRKRLIIILAAITILCSIAISVFISHKYTLIIEDGSGSGKVEGKYKAGTSVSVSAKDKEGYLFIGWSTKDLDIEEEDLKSNHLSFTMPRKTVVLHAEYEKEICSITVSGGKGSGSYEYGEEIPISAEMASNQQFSCWEVVSGSAMIADITSEETTLVVNGSAKVSAVFEEIDDDSMQTSTDNPVVLWNVTVNSGTGDGQYKEGDIVTIAAEEQLDGREFLYWEIDSGDVDISNLEAEITFFAMPNGNVTVTAIYEDAIAEVISESPGDWRNNILKEDHGIVGELKANMQATTPAEKAFGVDAWNRDEILAIYVLDTLSYMPEDAVDISAAQDGSVMGWVDSAQALYIAGNGGVRAPEDSNALFAWFNNAKTIDFGGNLHTDMTTKISFLFCGCSSLEYLNLDGIVTDSVQYFTKVFAGCRSLRSLDLSSFRTPNALRFFGMFLNCSSLETLDLTSFQSSTVDDFQIMFRGCNSLREIRWNPQLFTTRSATNMGQMFYDCNALESVDVSLFDTSNVINMYMMFSRCFSLKYIEVSHWRVNLAKTNVGDIFAESYLEDIYGRSGELLFGTVG